LAQRRKKTEGQPGDPLERLSSLSLEARKLSDALSSHNRPSAALVQSVEKLQEMITLFAESGELVKIKDDESAALRIAMDELPEQLSHHCDDKGIRMSGAFPDFIFDGVVYLRVLSSEGLGYVNGSKHQIWPIELLVSVVETQLQQLSTSKRETPDFLERLWQAYSAVLQQRAGREQLNTKRVGIYQILPQMALLVQTPGFLKNPTHEQFRTYSQHDLRADLFAVMQTGTLPLRAGSRLVLEPTSVAEDGLFMYIPSLQRCGYIGHISFIAMDADGEPR
jgi:hypothetical protein